MTHGVSRQPARFTHLANNASSDLEDEIAKLESASEPSASDKSRLAELKSELEKIVKKKDVPFVWSTTSLDSSIVEQLKQQEADMHAADKLVADTEVSLVSFYEIRRLISDCLSCDI